MESVKGIMESWFANVRMGALFSSKKRPSSHFVASHNSESVAPERISPFGVTYLNTTPSTNLGFDADTNIDCNSKAMAL